MVDHGTHGTTVGAWDHNHNNRSYRIRITRTGCIVTRNSQHIKTTPITAEQYLRDQLTQDMDDPVDRILKQYETLSTDKVQSNTNNKRRGNTHKHSDIEISDIQGHTINIVPNSKAYRKQ